MNYWDMLESLIESNQVIIERPKGCPHPKFPEMIYPVDYGYIKNTKSMDGGGIDIFIGQHLLKSVTGIICTIDKLKNDSEIKVLFACSHSEMEIILNFLNHSDFMKAILINRE